MKKLFLIVLLGVPILLAASSARSQPDGKQTAAGKAPGITKRSSIVREGFTRPGNPPDVKLPNGKVRYVAWDSANKQDVIGGTIYWMVLENTGSDSDPWGTGITKFTEGFREGKDFQNRFSPGLDTSAKYLYLYQVVNDRGLEPLPIRPAANTELPVRPIARASLRLLVDPRDITSWGYFKDLGFAAEVADRKFDGTSAAGLGQPDKMIRMAVSSNPSILAELNEELYTMGSPAYPLGELKQTFGIDRSTVGLASSWAAKELQTNPNKYASWGQNELKALKGANSPDYVLISVAGYDFRNEVQGAGNVSALAQGETDAQFVFQAYWDKDKVKLGEHTTIFGFTSNLPPVDEEIRIADLEALQRGAIRAAGNASDVVPASAEGIAPAGMAPGTAPTPAGSSTPAGFGGALGSIGGMVPGMAGGGGGGPSGAGSGFGGGIGGASGLSGIPGGGISGSSSSGNGNSTQQQKQQQQNQQNQNQNQQNLPSTPVTVNITQNITQQQTQTQTQTQQQQQQQQQSQQQTPGTPAIPEPAAIVLACIALPFVWICVRRRLPGRAKAVVA